MSLDAREPFEPEDRFYQHLFSGAVPSVEGIGVPDKKNLYFSPCDVTKNNLEIFLHELEPIASARDLAVIGLIGRSAVGSNDCFEDKLFEAAKVSAQANERWQAQEFAPVQREASWFESERDRLWGVAETLRQEAVEEAAKLGLEFGEHDLDSASAVQHMIGRNVKTDAETLGGGSGPDLDSPTPPWALAIMQISLLIVSTVTGAGMIKVFTGLDIATAINRPIFPIFVGVGLGLSVPALICAYRYGWALAAEGISGDRSMVPARRWWSAVVGALWVLVMALPIAGIDAMGFTAFAHDLAHAAARVGGDAGTAWWAPVIGFAFMGTATVAKACAGHHDCRVKCQRDRIAHSRRTSADYLRGRAATLITAIGRAKLYEDQLAACEIALEARRVKLSELEFTPRFSEELKEATSSYRDSWLGESHRFWRTVTAMLSDAPARTMSTASKAPGPLRSMWSKLFPRGGR